MRLSWDRLELCGNAPISMTSGNLLREFVNSIMNFMFMTLPHRGLPSTDLTLQMSKSITRQGFGEHAMDGRVSVWHADHMI